jgi:tRNA(Ile)-lysidine synthase
MDIVRELEASVKRYVREQRLPLDGHARVVLAVSGGADSTATTALLLEAGLVDARRATVAHFDHRLRGDEESACEHGAVRGLCERYGLPLVERAWDRPRPTEQSAREARYAFLADAAREAGANVVVTGHTADDQAETVFMRMLRGAGAHGLAGMAAESPLPAAGAPSVRLLRPMLSSSCTDTRAYCAARGLAYHDDPTNARPAHLRNRVRLELLPRLPGARDALLRLAARSRARASALDGEAAAAIAPSPEGEVRLSRGALRAMPAEVATAAARLAVVRLLGDAREYERRHLVRLAGAAAERTGATLELPRGVVATVDADAIVLSAGPPGPPPVPDEVTFALPFSGTLGSWHVAIEPAAAEAVGAIVLPPDAVVRARRPGDRIRPPGMAGSKKLQDYYVDRKVPRRERDGAPVVAAGREVYWTPFGAGTAPPGGIPYAFRCERVPAGPAPVLDGLHRPRYSADVASEAPATAGSGARRAVESGSVP